MYPLERGSSSQVLLQPEHDQGDDDEESEPQQAGEEAVHDDSAIQAPASPHDGPDGGGGQVEGKYPHRVTQRGMHTLQGPQHACNATPTECQCGFLFRAGASI